MSERLSRIEWSQDLLLIPLLVVGIGIVAVDLVAAHTGHVQQTEDAIPPATTVPPRPFQLLLPPNLPENTAVSPRKPTVAHHPVAKVSANVTVRRRSVQAAPLSLTARRPAPMSTVTTSST